MDPTAVFFSKLKTVARTLETESVRLQQAFEKRGDEEEDSEATARGTRAFHELNCEVANLKGQIQGQLTQQKAQVSEVSGFIAACRLMQQRVGRDVHALRTHWEQYGYQAPADAHKNKDQDSKDEDEEEEEGDEDDEEEGSQEESGGDPASPPPPSGPPPLPDLLRTPQLSDFGLSELQLKRVLAGAELCSQAPPMPEIRLPRRAVTPPLPLTPKCALRMDEDELLTPQMHHFGLTEKTMCLNNDFTMNLLRRDPENPLHRIQDKSESTVESEKENILPQEETLESPEIPVFCTPGFKIRKTTTHYSPPGPDTRDPEPGVPLVPLQTTPEVPAFQTPYVKRLVSTKSKQEEAEQEEAEPSVQTSPDDHDDHVFKLPTPPHIGAGGSQRPWEYDVPEIPDLEPNLMNSLKTRRGRILRKTEEHQEKTNKDLGDHSAESDGSTQEFRLGTPRIRRDYQDQGTPEMPDLSSVTQDICRLVSQAQQKKADVLGAEKQHRSSCVRLPLISESEFQTLPSYLRQMSLNSLNQVVVAINNFTANFHGERTELQMEELSRISQTGPKTPVFALCLTELRRLQQVGGARDTAVYRLLLQQH